MIQSSGPCNDLPNRSNLASVLVARCKNYQPMMHGLKTIVTGTLNSKPLAIPSEISTELHPSRLDVIRKLIHQETETINLIAGGIAKKSVIP